MNALKIIGLIVLSILLVFTGWSYLLGMSIEKTVFNLSYYEEVLQLEEVDLDSFISGIIDQVEIDPENEQLEETIEHVDEEETQEPEEELFPEMDSLIEAMMTDALKETIEVTWVEEQLLLIIEDVLDLAKGETETLSVVIELDDLQDDFFDNLRNRVETISDDELIAAGVPEEEVDQFRSMFIEDFVTMMEEGPADDGESMELPASIDLGELMQEGELSPEFEEALANTQRYHQYFPLTHYAVFALILLFSCLLAGLIGGLKWFGATTLFTGITFLLGLLIARAVLLVPVATGISEEMPFAADIVMAAAGYTITRLYSLPLIFALVGLVLLVGAIIAGRVLRKQK